MEGNFVYDLGDSFALQAVKELKWDWWNGMSAE